MGVVSSCPLTKYSEENAGEASFIPDFPVTESQVTKGNVVSEKYKTSHLWGRGRGETPVPFLNFSGNVMEKWGRKTIRTRGWGDVPQNLPFLFIFCNDEITAAVAVYIRRAQTWTV